MIASLHDIVTDRRGFPVFLTVILAVYCALRLTFPDAPSNADVVEQVKMMSAWRLGYGSGANPPLFTWLAILVDKALAAPALAVELVRFAMLWLFCLFTAGTVRAMTDDARLGALAGLSAFAIYAVGWEALFRNTNTMMLIASIPMTLGALVRLDRGRDAGAYLAVAAATAFGFYSKYTYAVVWVGFFGAALFDARLRARLLDRRMLLAMIVVVLLLSPLFYWAAEHFDAMMNHGRRRFYTPPHYPQLGVYVSAMVDIAVAAAGLLVPLLPILLLVFPRLLVRVTDAGDFQRRRWRRLLRRYLAITIVSMIAGILAFRVTHFQTRYIYVLLPILPLAFLRVASAGSRTRPRQWLAAILVLMAISVAAGMTYRGVTYADRKARAAHHGPAYARSLAPAGSKAGSSITVAASGSAKDSTVNSVPGAAWPGSR